MSKREWSLADVKVPATKKRPSRSAKKRVVYFDKSDLELESDEDGNEAPKNRSFKKKANTENWVSNVKMGSKAVTALSFEREVHSNVSISAIFMKIFLMSQDSIDLEKPTKTKFAIMWDAMKKMHKPLAIEGSAEADNHLVEIIRKKQRGKQLTHASDRPFANLRGSNNGIGMGNSWVPSTNKHVMRKQQRKCKPTILSDERKHSDTATSPINKIKPG
jgi:hypothetical protein